MNYKILICLVIGVLLLTKYSYGQEYGVFYKIDTFKGVGCIYKQPKNPFELNDSTWVFVKFRRKGRIRLYYTLEPKFYLDKRIKIGLIEDYNILPNPLKKESLNEVLETGELKKEVRYYYNTEKIKIFQKNKSFRRRFFFLKRISSAAEYDYTEELLK